MKKCFFLILIILALVVMLTGCVAMTYECDHDSPLHIAYSDVMDNAFVSRYYWDGTEEGKKIIIPEEYKGLPVTTFGGYIGRGLPCSFAIEISDKAEEILAPNADKWLEEYDVYAGYINYEIKPLVFEVHVSKNISKIDDDGYGVYIKNYEAAKYMVDGIPFYELYVVSAYVTCDENNKTFYAKDGRLYYREDDKLVENIRYWDSDFEEEFANKQKYDFIPQEEKDAWSSDLSAILQGIEIHDYEEGVLGSLSVGLMDINFDNSPEVLVAYGGGSIGNVPVEIYDLKTHQKIADYHAGYYFREANIFLCVAKVDGELVVMSEGSMRSSDFGMIKRIGIMPKTFEGGLSDISPQIIFAEGDSGFYEYYGEKISKDEYDQLYNKFFNRFNPKMIESTQIKLIRWSSLDGESKDELVDQMVDALINSSQKFLDYSN